MSLILVSPRTFLPLLLFIGFVFTLIGIGFSEVSAYTGANLPNLFALGIVVMLLAIILFVAIVIFRS